MTIRLSHPGPLRKVAFAALLALAFPITAIAVAPTVGLAVIALGAIVDQQLARPHAPNLPLEGRSTGEAVAKPVGRG